jgi:hypothetical protein
MTPSAPVANEGTRPEAQEKAIEAKEEGTKAPEAEEANIDPAPAFVSQEPVKEAVPEATRAPSTGLGWYLLLAVLAFGGVFIRLAMTSSQPPADLDVPAGAEIAPGEGMAEIAAPAEDVLIDGVPRGRGPRLVVTLQAGSHELKCGGITKNVEIVPGRMRKFDVSSP